ncbi:hypothetical protein [Herpetosiphon sp. NSE202]|uniref:hypothetical protein n=1 Tax=Herpetosiphon sp. NSE202 TaxID=3351349 RepID=UPI003639F947
MSKQQPQPGRTDRGLIAEETVLRLLSESDPSAQSSLYQPLRQRLFQQKTYKEIKPMRTPRFALLFGLALVALLALTPVRSSLAAVLQQFGLIRVTDQATSGQQFQGQQLPAYDPSLPEPTSVPAPSIASIESLSSQLGSHVYAASTVPAGYQLLERHMNVGSIGSTVISYYANQQDTTNADQAMISLSQTHQTQANAQAYDFAVGSAASTPVQVRGVSGLWIEQAPLLLADDGTGHFTTVGVNVLVWSDGANSFKLESNRLDLAAMKAFAESLQ